MHTLSLKKIITWLVIAFLVVLGLRFLFRSFHYFTLTEASYGAYFWPRSNWVLAHLICGMTALLIGPFQFVNAIRRKYVRVHRTMGKIYLIAIALGATAGFYLAVTSQVSIAYAGGLFGLALTWSTTSAMAYISILNGKWELHKEWMTRSYVITFAFITFRLFDEILSKTVTLPDNERLALLAWAAWSIPLFFTEVVLQGRKLGKKNPVPPGV